jgi:hypothetical protein
MKKKQSKKIYCPYNKQTIVSINGKLCALQPGNTILFNDKDTMAKTIVDINIDIEGGVKYHLKWFDGYTIKDIWMNENEISSMATIVEEDDGENKNNRCEIGFK